MSNAQVRDKILHLEAELTSIKAATKNRPDFAVDENNWARLKKDIKRNRQKLYRRVYGKK